MMYQVVTDKYFTDIEGGEATKLKEEITEIEGDGFAVDQHGTLFIFENPPEVEIANADGQRMKMPQTNPKPIHAFADQRWIECRRA